MKDSHINGGATGNREGLKYIAAAYLSYLKKWSFFVWSDSAGTNIRKGVVSLNRGAEGFMMNSLMAERVDFESLMLYTSYCINPGVQKIFNEFDQRFDLSQKDFNDSRSLFQFFSVVMGSSAGLDAYGAEKIRIFIELLNNNKIPLVMLSNSSGFVPGSQRERLRIQAIGAGSINANTLGKIPVVSIVLNQNYCGRLIYAFNKFLRLGIVFLALDNACLSVIGVDAAFFLLEKKKYDILLTNGEKEKAVMLY